MKTTFSRLVALACAVAMLFSFVGTAFATEDPEKTPITIKTLDPARGEVTFNGVAEGDDVSVDFDKIEMELYGYGISTEVTTANVCEYPYDADAEKVYDTYTVDYDKVKNTIAVEMTNLMPHKNAQDKVAFWTGFAVTAPKGADSFDYALGDISDGEDCPLELIDAGDPDTIEDDVYGVAFYFDANAWCTVGYVGLQWFDENGEPVSDWEYAAVDISGVECYEKNGTVVSANVRDFYDDNAVYESYSVKEKNDTVTIKMDGLKEHENGEGNMGYWTGFAVTAPEGADTFDYVIDNGWYYSSESYEPVALETIDENGTKGVAFYFDAQHAGYDYESEKLVYYVSLQWYDAEGAPISARTDYYVDVTDVKIYELKGKVVKANVRDYHDDFNVYTSYEVEEKNGIVTISMDDLLMHKSSDDNGNAPAFWTGFAVAVPEGHEEIKSFNYHIEGDYYSESYEPVALETIDENGTKGVAFYLDAEDAGYDYENEKLYYHVSLQWCDEAGKPLSAWTNYYVDVTDVDCKYFDRDTIMPAKLVDNATEPNAELCTDYKVDCEYGNVVITAKDLEKHENGEGNMGYWTGFAVTAPEGATKFEYEFGNTSSDGLVEVEFLDAGETEAPEDNIYGAAFYLDAGDFDAKDYVDIKWYREDGTPYDNIRYYYNIDFTGVGLSIDDEFDVDSSIKTAPISDKNDPPKELLTEENKDSYTVELTGNVIKISAKELRAHINGEGDRGAWVGVQFDEAPESAVFAKYAFAGSKAEAKWIWNNSDYTVETEEARFYVNAFYPDTKDTVMLQWFDVDGKALTNIKTYEIDTTGVECDVEGKETEIELAPVVDQTLEGPSDIAPYFGENFAKLAGNVITLGADCLFMHNNSYMENGAWIGFTVKVEGAAYVKYAFANDYYDELDWQYNATEGEIDGQESFYVDASAYRPKNKLMVQWFDENGDALTKVNTYDINIEKVNWSDIEQFDVLFSNIMLAGEDAEDYELVYDGAHNLADNQYVEGKTSRDYVYAYAEVYGNGTVTNNGKVWVRDTDYSDGITKNTLTAKADSGYKLEGWYVYGEPASTRTSIKIDQDKCYYFETVFEKKTTGSGGGGGGLIGSVTDDKKEDKVEEEPEQETGATTPSMSFNDVSANAWYYDVVKTAVEKGLMNGISATEFAPNASLTRGMFVTVLYRAAGEPGITSLKSFADVPANQYYANAVAWASANGIVNGVSADKFDPNASITREQMAAIIYRFGTMTQIEVEADNEISYTDAERISPYAEEAAKWAYNAGVILGNADGSFAPQRTATRAEAAAIFVRLLAVMQ